MPHVEVPQAEFKAVVLGDSHVGKSSLVTRFAEGYYREHRSSRGPPATIGARFVARRIQSTDGTPTKVQLWDTAGDEGFKAAAPSFYKGASAVIACYDVARRETFDGMRGRLDEVRRRTDGGTSSGGAEGGSAGGGGVGGGMVVAVAALKTDLLREGGFDSAAVPEREAEQFAEAVGAFHVPTSAKTGRNVDELFREIADRVLRMRATTAPTNGGAVDGGANDDRVGGRSARTNGAASNAPSPRRRDRYDRCYDAGALLRRDGADGTDHRRSTSPDWDDAEPPPPPPPSSARSRSGRRGKRTKDPAAAATGTGGTTSRSNPDDDDGGGGTGADDSFEGHLISKRDREKQKRKGGTNDGEGSGNEDGRKEDKCADESLYACQPMACGAGEGGYGCVVQ
ncbi:hypothetical protein ACHAWF_002804 [Thalassiosira exigua]